MALFLSKFTNKIDKKGRVSVPARFRSVLTDNGFSSIVLFPTFDSDALNACDMNVMEDLLQKIGGFDPFSEDRESDADVLMAESIELPIDGDGRIVVPLDLLKQVGIDGVCVFAGRGDSFQISTPEAFDARMKSAKERARAKRAKSAQIEQGE